MPNTIHTRTCSLTVTLSAIAVCWWALATDFACGLRAVTSELWGAYLQDRLERRQFDTTHPVTAEPAQPGALDRFEQLEQSALDAVAWQVGTPAGLWLSVLVGVVLVVLIDIFNGWPALFAALAWLPG